MPPIGFRVTIGVGVEMVATTHLSITSSILSRDVVAVLGVYVSNKAFFLASRAVVLLAASFESIAVLSSHRDRNATFPTLRRSTTIP